MKGILKNTIATPLVNNNKTPYQKWGNDNYKFEFNEIINGNEFKWINSEGEEKQGQVTGKSILTGEVSNITVIDIDNGINEKGEIIKDGKNQFIELLKEANLSSENINTFSVETPHGGLHLYFKYTDKLKNIAPVDKEKYQHIDIRNKGGLIVAPGTSVFSDKKLFKGLREYKIINNTDIQEMPQSLLDVLVKYAGKKKAGRKTLGDKMLGNFEEARNASLNQFLFTFCKSHNVRNELEILALANAFNLSMCKPPLGTVEGEENEVSNIARSVFEALENHYINDKGYINQMMFIDHLLKENHIFTDKLKTCIYDDEKGVYVPKSDTEIKQWIINKVDPRESVTNGVLSEVHKLLQTVTSGKREEDFEKKYINCKNCLFDIDKRERFKHSPKILSTSQINANLLNQEDFWSRFKESTFAQYLIDVFDGDKQLIDTLQEVTGLAISPHAREVQKAFVLKGSGSNGKSVYMDILSYLLGKENISTVPIEAFQDKFAVSTLSHKLLNLVDDDQTEHSNQPQAYKSSISGGVVRLEEKHKNGESESLNITHIRGMNELPTTSDKTDGFFRRHHIIPFNVKFGTKEQVEKGLAQKEKDPILFDKLKEEIDLIFSWGVYGLLKLKNNNWNLTSSEVINRENEEYRRDVDSLYSFISEFIERTNDTNDYITTKQVGLVYEQWCIDNRLTPIGGRKIKSKIEELTGVKQGNPSSKTGNERGFLGLKLNCTVLEETPKASPFKVIGLR